MASYNPLLGFRVNTVQTSSITPITCLRSGSTYITSPAGLPLTASQVTSSYSFIGGGTIIDQPILLPFLKITY
jgi:hypothetical protein